MEAKGVRYLVAAANARTFTGQNQMKKKIIIHPRLAGGTSTFVCLLFFAILEKITGFGFVSKHLKVLSIPIFFIAFVVSTIFGATYDKTTNDDKLFTIIGLTALGLLIVLICLF
jgi:hypothetical protein